MKINELYGKNEPITVNNYFEKFGINLNSYLERTEIEDLCNYDNIYNVANQLLNSIKWGEDVYILCDSDFDGFMSSSMSYVFFKSINPNIEIKPIFHIENPKGHGLEDEIMLYLKDKEPSVLFIPDASTNDIKQHNKLKKIGWSVLIADHHISIKNLENDYIVNNQMSTKVQNKQLSGCGVTHKVLMMIDKLNGTNYASDLLSYVHFANIGDSCGFNNNEQETYRYWGLQNIHKNLRPFVEEFNEDITNNGFSFGMVSRINSVVRVGSLEEKEKLFYALCGVISSKEVIKICKRCKTIQDNEKKNLYDYVKIIHNGKVVIAKIEQKTSLTGLIANILMSEYNKPILLLHYKDSGECAGSARSPVPLRKQLEDSGLFLYASGHESSFGVSYKKENEKAIITYLDSVLRLSEPQIDVLKSYTTKSMPKSLWGLFKPYRGLWGHGIQNPKFHLSFTYNPKDMNVLGKYGTTLRYNDNGISFLWEYINRYKKVELGLGYLDEDDVNSSGLPTFVYNPQNKKYIMEVIGTLQDDDTVKVEKYWFKEKGLESFF